MLGWSRSEPGRASRVPQALRLPAPRLVLASSLDEALSRRRSLREFGRRPLADSEVGALLWAGQGVTSRAGGRTAPSAGALYPLTLSLADARGVWRYQPDRHSLALGAPGDARPALASAALGQRWVSDAPVAIAVSADLAVLAAEYGRRAERYCVLEAGHAAQNVLLAATALGLGAVAVAAFDDDGVRAALALPAGHLPLYLVPVGPAPEQP